MHTRLLFAALVILLCVIDSFAARAPGTRPRGPGIPDVPRDQVICFCLYTTHNGVLKLTAQLYPLKDGEARDVQLEIEREGQWNKAADGKVDEEGWAATFRVENWDNTASRKYRVRHAGGTSYEGLIRRDPKDKDEI